MGKEQDLAIFSVVFFTYSATLENACMGGGGGGPMYEVFRSVYQEDKILEDLITRKFRTTNVLNY